MNFKGTIYFKLAKKLKAIVLLPFSKWKQIALLKKDKEFYFSLIRPNSTVYDIGANDGLKTSIFLSLDARVIAIEPQPLMIDSLKKRFRKNEKVSIVHCALGQNEDELVLKICSKAPTISTLSDKWVKMGRFSKTHHWDKEIIVKVTTLDTLIKEYGQPDFIKIDVEGYEYQVIQGLSYKVPLISFEFTKEFIGDVENIFSHLKTLGVFYTNYSCSNGFVHKEFIVPDQLISELKANKNEFLTGDIYVKFQY